MWSFLIAFFLGGYYLIKYLKVSCEEDAAERKFKSYESNMNTWRAVVTDSALENRFCEERNREGYKRHAEEAIAILREVTEIPELKFNPLPKNTYTKWNASLYILMVREGKLPALDAANSFGHIEMALGSKLPKEAKIKFLRWVESQLSDRGVRGSKLYYYHRSPTTWFAWEPFVSDFDVAVPISDENIVENISNNCFL